MPTNIKEKGFEALIVNYLIEQNGYEQGENADYNREYAVDETRLFCFIENTQPEQFALLKLDGGDVERRKFLSRLCGEITKRGVIDVLRNGIKIYPANLVMFYMTPSEKNQKAKEMFGKNIFSVIRQLQYSRDSNLALDFCIFINGLPVITCELKNQLTNQRVEDAVEQYKTDRDPKELIFQFKRCMAHFAADDARIKFCTKLEGKKSWFLPFDKGFNYGAGNPPNPGGIMTDYLWKQILTKPELANIIENYAQVTKEKDRTGKITEKQVFPRYHQLSAVESLLADVVEKGVGQRYLIQHSAGSGKSNSIAWLAHKLVGIESNGTNIIDSVIVVTDRVNLDKQIRNTIKSFTQSSHIIAWAERSGDLKKYIQIGKKIIITTVHKFPFILEDIGAAHKNRKFAILIDEAHSSQSGNMSAKMNIVLGGDYDPDLDVEDKINALIEGRKMLKNASYFAFTATPKDKTIEMFGKIRLDESGRPVLNEKGEPKRESFHKYSMKQAIQEGFILDVLKYYTPVKCYYKLAKTIEDDPKFDKKKAKKKLRRFVESDSYPLSVKADIIVEHFHSQVIAQGKIGGKARAMVVANGIDRAIDYYRAINECLRERKSSYKAIIAFSGDREYDGKIINESVLNGFPSSAIEDTFKTDPYRFLIVADKFQTGYDEPLLHTMYVDKPLSDIKAVQTLSRLNRAHPQKHDTFILDFANEAEVIKKSFSAHYITTILSGETDPNKLYDKISVMRPYEVYTQYHIDTVVELYLSGGARDKLDPHLDICAKNYRELDTDSQIKFKASAKDFVRTYGFLGAILPIGNPEWEKQSIFLNLLLPKLPSPAEDDLSQGVLDAIDLDSYRAEVKAQMAILLEDSEAEVGPVPTGTAGGQSEPELDLLTNILNEFNDLFGNINWNNVDNVRRQISRIPAMVANDKNYQNTMRNNDKQEARTVSERVLHSVMFQIMADNTELFKQYSDNPAFKKWLSDFVFTNTYSPDGREGLTFEVL